MKVGIHGHLICGIGGTPGNAILLTTISLDGSEIVIGKILRTIAARIVPLLRICHNLRIGKTEITNCSKKPQR